MVITSPVGNVQVRGPISSASIDRNRLRPSRSRSDTMRKMRSPSRNRCPVVMSSAKRMPIRCVTRAPARSASIARAAEIGVTSAHSVATASKLRTTPPAPSALSTGASSVSRRFNDPGLLIATAPGTARSAKRPIEASQPPPRLPRSRRGSRTNVQPACGSPGATALAPRRAHRRNQRRCRSRYRRRACPVPEVAPRANASTAGADTVSIAKSSTSRS